jgi:hypothetical protein
MKIKTKDFEKLVREMIRDIVSDKSSNQNNNDLFQKQTNWDEIKIEFKDTINDLLKNIEDEEFDNANNQIDKSIDVLKKWKSRIEKIIDEENIKS